MSICTSKNPKLLISNYFDSLIREVDIFTEEKLANKNSKNLVKIDDNVEISLNKKPQINAPEHDMMDFDEVDDFYHYGQFVMWTELECAEFERNRSTNEPCKSMKECDYWNETRDVLLEKLNELQKETFEHYDTIREELKRDMSSYNDMESIMARVFEKRFPFIVIYGNSNDKGLCEKIYLVELDFYIKPCEYQFLK